MLAKGTLLDSHPKPGCVSRRWMSTCVRCVSPNSLEGNKTKHWNPDLWDFRERHQIAISSVILCGDFCGRVRRFVRFSSDETHRDLLGQIAALPWQTSQQEMVHPLHTLTAVSVNEEVHIKAFKKQEKERT